MGHWCVWRQKNLRDAKKRPFFLQSRSWWAANEEKFGYFRWSELQEKWSWWDERGGITDRESNCMQHKKNALRNFNFFRTCIVLILFSACETIFYFAELLEKLNKLTGSYFYIKLPSKVCLDAFVWLLTIKTKTFFHF